MKVTLGPDAARQYTSERRLVISDANLITSGKPDDVPQFTAALIGASAKGAR